MKRIEVVAAVIRHEEAILATQRGYGEWKGWWEFPGGKIELGESQQEALRREIREELDADIAVEDFIQTVEWDYPSFHLTMHCYWCSLRSEPTFKEHSAHRWLTRDQLREVEWLPADVQLVDEIQAQGQ